MTATMTQKIDYVWTHLKFKNGVTKKKLTLYCEQKPTELERFVNRVVELGGESIETWLSKPKPTWFYAEVEEDGKTATYEGKAQSMEEFVNHLVEKGCKVTKVVTRRGHHICPYCGSIADGTDKGLLCEDCRDTFGHAFYHEL